MRGVAQERPRRRPGGPAEGRAAVAAAWEQGRRRPPQGVCWGEWERVRAARAQEAARPLEDLRHRGPELAPPAMLLVREEVRTPAPGHAQVHALCTAYVATAEGRRYRSGRGVALLGQVRAAVQACREQSVLVVAEGGSWMRTV